MKCIDGSSLRPDQFNASLNFSRWGRYLFVNVPKAGNFTIKKSLILHEQAAGAPDLDQDPDRINDKNRPGSPWFDYACPGLGWQDFADHLQGARLVTNIRNPYTRVLSAWLDKIARGDDNPHRRAFCAAIGVEPDVQVGFREFLLFLADQEPWMMDGHWCPQVALIHPRLLRYDHVIRLERLEEDLKETLSALFGRHDLLGVELGHSTGAAERLERYYDAETAALVREIYADDFRILGYDPDPAAALDLPREIVQVPATTDLGTMERAYRAFRRFAGARAYYDLALEYIAEDDLDAAELLMNQAVEDNPYDLAHCRGLVNALKLTGNDARAARMLDFLIRLYPFQPGLFDDAVELDLRARDREMAVNHKVSALWLRANRQVLIPEARRGFGRGSQVITGDDPLVLQAVTALEE